MYTLRTILKTGEQHNKALGDSYSIVWRIDSLKEFTKISKIFFGDDDDHGDVFAFITSDGGSEIIPIRKNRDNYIMTEKGQTFSRLS